MPCATGIAVKFRGAGMWATKKASRTVATTVGRIGSSPGFSAGWRLLCRDVTRLVSLACGQLCVLPAARTQSSALGPSKFHLPRPELGKTRRQRAIDRPETRPERTAGEKTGQNPRDHGYPPSRPP